MKITRKSSLLVEFPHSSVDDQSHQLFACDLISCYNYHSLCQFTVPTKDTIRDGDITSYPNKLTFIMTDKVVLKVSLFLRILFLPRLNINP